MAIDHLASSPLRGAGLPGGKTRLAIEVAGDFADAFPDSVYFVDLSPLHDEAPLALPAHVLDVRAHRVQNRSTLRACAPAGSRTTPSPPMRH